MQTQSLSILRILSKSVDDVSFMLFCALPREAALSVEPLRLSVHMSVWFVRLSRSSDFLEIGRPILILI